MDGKYIKIFGFLILAVIYISIVAGCASKDRQSVIISHHGDVKANGSAVQSGDILQKGDSLLSGENGCAVILFGRQHVLFLCAGSEADLARNDSSVVSVPAGSAFFRIFPGAPALTVKTPSAVFTISSGSVQILSGKDASIVRVLSGKASIVPLVNGFPDSKHETAVSHGQSVDITDGSILSPSPMGGRISGNLQRLSDYPPAESAGFTLSGGKMPDYLRELLLSEGSGITDARLSLLRLEKKYGALSIVRLKSGKTFTGSVKVKGSAMEITTASGLVTFPSKDVMAVGRYAE